MVLLSVYYLGYWLGWDQFQRLSFDPFLPNSTHSWGKEPIWGFSTLQSLLATTLLSETKEMNTGWVQDPTDPTLQ